MLKKKSSLENYLSKICMEIAIDSEKCNELYNYVKDKYQIPRGIISDLVCFRMTFTEASEYVLFCLLDGLNHLASYYRSVEYYYSPQEINEYSKSKFKLNKINFPLRFKMVQIEDDQWVGKVDVHFLMQLRDAQLINYNVNAQRTMQKIIRGDKEIYKISLNKNAVASIQKSMEAGTFIPNTLTLNIPQEDYEADFYYDERGMELVINKLNCFHISDGFHRYIAACKASDRNKDFNYNMEVRIVNWAEPRVQTFIYQEDQKTPLRKMDSESLNMNKAANLIVNRVNTNVFCNMKGLISRNDGIINYGEMSALVDWFYLKKSKKTANTNAMQIQATKEITENLNIITESDLTYTQKKWDYKFLLTVFCVFDYFNKNSNLNKNIMNDVIVKTYQELKNTKDEKLKNKTPRKVLIDLVMNIVKNNI